MQKKQRHKERASQRMFPRGPDSFQRPYRRSAGITQARFELAFDREHPEKTALVLGCAPTVAAKSRSTKSIILSQGMETIGVEPLPPRLVNWQSDIRASVSQYQCGPRANTRWGPRRDHFTVGTVNMVETVLMGMPFTFQRSDPHG